MLTPQEVAQRSFGKASFGGYNMAMVDDFLDELTADYEALFNENALLKQKLGVLSGKIREYQATEEGMRKALMAAQQTADDMVKETETKCAQLLSDAEHSAGAMKEDIAQSLSAETQKLEQAKASVESFKKHIAAVCRQEMEFLAQLDDFKPAPEKRGMETTVEAIRAAVERTVAKEDEDLPTPLPQSEEPEDEPETEGHVQGPYEVEESSVALYEKLMADRKAAQGEDDESDDPTAPTRRVERRSLEFGKDFEID